MPHPTNPPHDTENEIVNDDETEPILLYTEIQTARCSSARYAGFIRCTACIGKKSGDGCRFQGIRAFLKNELGTMVGFSFPGHRERQGQEMQFPTEWNVPLQPQHIIQTKTAVAKALLPTLRQEWVHLNQKEVVHRPRESQFRSTCDTCMTSIFSSSWLCRLCGRESCPDCFEKVKELTAQPGGKHKFLLCSPRRQHTAEDFSPVSRFSKVELVEAIKEMEALLLNENFILSPQLKGSSKIDLPQYQSTMNGHDAPSDIVPSHATKHFTDSELSDEVFQDIWALGEPLVVTGLLSKFKIEWTPEFFIKTYGSERCFIFECETEVIKPITVGEFFSTFGKERKGGGCWKLKDWPSSADFKITFPALYQDFSNAVPVPNYVRRDGVLNISSHFPTNTVVPDLGPKMYNAQQSNESAGSQGTTRLHMDMADAMNIMVHAEPTPDGKPGTAAWDLFRTEDSDKIRQFLQDKFMKKQNNGGAVLNWGDPIHSQRFYLDSVLRRELFEKMGVKSHRVYQKPGEAVFIPAGCAHQVCNLSDCVKVASDFVSTQNITRCEKLTREFREQNQEKVWKEDVLQLRTMMWFAWLSCSSYSPKAAGLARGDEDELSELSELSK